MVVMLVKMFAMLVKMVAMLVKMVVMWSISVVLSETNRSCQLRAAKLSVYQKTKNLFCVVEKQINKSINKQELKARFSNRLIGVRNKCICDFP